VAITTVGLSKAEIAERLRLYRERHVISPVDVRPPLPGHRTYSVCSNDSIRILPRNGMSRTFGRASRLWRHDPDEIKALVEGVQRA
jgi:hypothetical protein